MKEIKSQIPEILKERISDTSPLIQIIQGPRQVGKTTALQQFFDQYNKKMPMHFVSGDAVTSPLWIQEQWQISRDEDKILIIDEIQKIPQWSEFIKKLWDDDKRKKLHHKVILTGSSSLSLQKGLTESLTGRFESIFAYHWNYHYSNDLHKMSLEDYLTYGGYPKSYSFIKDKKRWVDYMTHSIVETVIGKDILMQVHVKSPALFRQAFYLLSSFPGQVISYTKLLGQLQDKGNTDLVKSYIELYESAFLIKTIPKYSGNETRKKTSSPKIILMAPSLASFHRLDSLTDDNHGRIFESAVGAELIKANLNPYYWAEGDYEVDFVLKYKKHLIAIEVKSGAKKRSTSLEHFIKKYPAAKVVFVNKENFVKFSEDVKIFLDKQIF
ncbi:MAG: ATP-binding protein [Bdellovibrio sp.]